MDLTTSILQLVGLMNSMPRSKCTGCSMSRDISRTMLLKNIMLHALQQFLNICFRHNEL